MIKVENLSKKYGDFLAVDNISFNIEKGKIIGFVGKNGAGKSTAIRCILNMIFPTSGKITVDGMDSIKETKKIKEKLSYMPSEFEFYGDLKVMDFFKFCLKFTEAKVERVEELAEYFELNLTKKIGELSLGNRKKVSIIQSIIKQGKIIVLDEPTSGLDPLMQNRFFELLLKEKEKGVTIFLSSHNLSEVEKYCDKVIVIKDGKIVDTLDMQEVKIKHKQIVSYVTCDGKKEEYEFDGEINELIAKLSTMKLESVEIKNKSVEDEFITYYKED